MQLKDFKEWLNQFPDDTIVLIIDVEWTECGTNVGTVEFDPSQNSHFNGKTLQLGIF